MVRSSKDKSWRDKRPLTVVNASSSEDVSDEDDVGVVLVDMDKAMRGCLIETMAGRKADAVRAHQSKIICTTNAFLLETTMVDWSGDGIQLDRNQ